MFRTCLAYYTGIWTFHCYRFFTFHHRKFFPWFLNRKMSHSKVQIVTRVTVPSFRSCKTWVLERGGGFTQLLKLVVSIITPNKHSDYNYTEYYFNFWRTINTLDSYLSFRRKEYAIHYHWRKPLTNYLTFNLYRNQTSANKEGGEV